MSRLTPTVLLLLSSAAVLGIVLAQAPGEQEQTCQGYKYPMSVTVLMDSWDYNRVLLPVEDGINQSTVWDRISLNETETRSLLFQWKYDGSGCQYSMVKVCSLVQGYQNNWLFTQYINKNVPANDYYPVRVFVNITYSFMTCSGRVPCSPEFKLLKYVTNSQQPRTTYTNTSLYSGKGIMPDNIVKNTTLSGTKHFYFDMSEEDKGFYLALQDHDEDRGACVTVSRVLVYRHQCRAHVENLVHFPAIQAPVSGTVSVRSECTRNAHHQSISGLVHVCTSEGQWSNAQVACECDVGYYMSDNMCGAYITPTNMSYVVTEEQQSVDVCFNSELSIWLTVNVVTKDNTAVASFDYVPVNKTLLFSPPVDQHCVKIHIVNDTLQESEESFVVDIISPEGINISHTEVSISPSNDDSGCEDGSITVVSGINSSLQLVEMCSERVWSPVCDHNWTIADATVVCRELGYHHIGLAEVLESGGVPHHKQMVPECEGTESSLAECLKPLSDVLTCHFVLVECTNNTSVVTITTSLLSLEPTTTLPSVEASDRVHIATIAGVAVSVAVIAILVLLVLLVALIVWRRKKDKELRVGYLDNPMYSIAECPDNQLNGQDTGKSSHDKVLEKLQETPSRVAANTDPPEYSTLEESIVPAEYEVPLALSPTAENSHHYHIDDSATSPAQSTGADYAVLEQTNHIYESEPSVASSKGEIGGQGQPTGIEGSQLQGEYATIEPK